MKHDLKSSLLVAAALFLTGASALLITSCEEKPKSVGESVKDGLNMRENEKAKDAAEDVKDAAKDAAEGVKDAAKDAKEAVKDATN
ncbi:MAG: hypothetical protein ACAI34_12270 [Verrucomicrobium sp.]|nr:hypothetical protein [Verrucomicrobium sp.]